MLTLEKLRTKFKPTTPTDALESLDVLLSRTDLPPGYQSPLITIMLHSGASIRGYLVGAISEDGVKAFLFSLERLSDGGGVDDLCYVRGDRIEAATFWNVEDFKGILPRHAKRPGDVG